MPTPFHSSFHWPVFVSLCSQYALCPFPESLLTFNSFNTNSLAHRVGLSVLALKRMLFILIRVNVRASLAATSMLLDVPVRVVSVEQNPDESLWIKTYFWNCSMLLRSISPRTCNANLMSLTKLSQRCLLKSSRTTTRIIFRLLLCGAMV